MELSLIIDWWFRWLIIIQKTPSVQKGQMKRQFLRALSNNQLIIVNNVVTQKIMDSIE